MNAMHEKALKYIENAGGQIAVAYFDEDHEPIGPLLRVEMVKAGLIEIVSDVIIRKKLLSRELDSGDV